MELADDLGHLRARIVGRRRLGRSSRCCSAWPPCIRRCAASACARRAATRACTSPGPCCSGGALLVGPLLRGAHRVLPAFPDIDDSLAAASRGRRRVAARRARGAALPAAAAPALAGLPPPAAIALDQRGRMLEHSQSRYRSLVEQIPGRSTCIALGEDGRRRARCTSARRPSEIIGLSVRSSGCAASIACGASIPTTAPRGRGDRRGPGRRAASPSPPSTAAQARTARRSGSATSAPW